MAYGPQASRRVPRKHVTEGADSRVGEHDSGLTLQTREPLGRNRARTSQHTQSITVAKTPNMGLDENVPPTRRPAST